MKRVANSFTGREIRIFNELAKFIERSNETEVLCRSDAYRALRKKFLAMDTRLIALEDGSIVEH